MQYKTRAIVLKTNKLGEADKILSLYSPDYGLIRAVAKGAYKSSNKHGGKAQVLSLSEFMLAKGRNLDIVVQAELVDDFRELRKDYDALAIACFFADVLESLAVEDNHYSEHFELLYASLLKLNENIKLKYYVALKFLWDLTKELGYKPELRRCSLSSIEKPEHQAAQYFDFLNGGIASSKAYEEYVSNNPYQDHIDKINTKAFKSLERLDQASDQNPEGEENPEPEKEAIKILAKHLSHSTSKSFKTWKVLEPILV